jgi:hypothetical protein
MADYDIGAPEQEQTDAPAAQISVTRLILAIYPVPAVPSSASGSQETSNSKPVRPPAPLLENGWLFFKL